MALGCHFSFQVKRQSRCNERSLCSDIIASSVKRICKIHFPSVTFPPKPCCPDSKSRNMILENCSRLCTKYRFAHLWHLVLGSMLKLFKLNKWMRYVIVDKYMKINLSVPTDLLLNDLWCIFQFLYLGSNFFSLSIQAEILNTDTSWCIADSVCPFYIMHRMIHILYLHLVSCLAKKTPTQLKSVLGSAGRTQDVDGSLSYCEEAH